MFDKMTDRLGSKIDVIFCVIDEKDSMTYHEVKRKRTIRAKHG
jgi:hypothetical protein